MQIIPQLDTGGAELSTLEITEAVTRAGGKMLVVSQGGRLADDLAAKGGKLIDLPAASKNPLRIAGNALALAQLIRKHKVNLIHARSRAPAWSALMAARKTDIPFVTTYHGAYSEKSRFKNLYNSVMARADVVIANSRYTAELIRSRYDTPQSRIQVIYRGVDVARFDPARVTPREITQLRSAWGVADNDTMVLQAARMTAWKGHKITIAAFDRLIKQGPISPHKPAGKVTLIFAGDAQGRENYLEDLHSDITQRGLQDHVRLVGHCDNMPVAFAAAQVAVVGSDGTTPEAFGRATAEAQAAGCPVIAADFGAPPEIIKASPRCANDDITGWLVPPADAVALAAALHEALAVDDQARQTLRQRARQHVLDHFTDETMKRQTMRIYDELLGCALEAAFTTS